MNVYDFDRTIYRGDSTVDFWVYCITKKPAVLCAFPEAAFAGFCFKLGLFSRMQFKESFYRFLKYLPDTEAMVQQFWEKNFRRMEPWYLERRQPEDLVVSASPEFLVSAACMRLGIKCIASNVDPATGKLLGPNCRGEEKVRLFREEYPVGVIESFFSDSLSDAPLAGLSAKAYLVRKGKISPWPEKNVHL